MSITIPGLTTNYYSASTAPPGMGVQTMSGDPTGAPTSGMSSGDFTTISSMVANAAGGGFAAFKLLGRQNPGGIKGFAMTGLKGAGLSALVSAGVSAVGNGIGVATGKVDASTAVSNVLTDAVTGTAGGLGALTVGGIGRMIFSKFGMAGVPLTIASVVLGSIGGTIAGQAVRGVVYNATGR